MDIEFLNVNENRVFLAEGPGVRFDIDDQGSCAVRVVLTIDEDVHVTYPSRRKDGRTQATRTLAVGRHAASVVIAAHALDDARRDYDTTITINGTPVVRARGAIAAGKADESQIQLFQLRVKST